MKFSTDFDFMGDTIHEKEEATIRIYCTNVNGISAQHQYEKFHSLLYNMNNLGTDIACFTEHNLDVAQPKIRYDLHKIVRRHIPSSRTIAATSPSKFPTPFKPGGCMNIIAKTLHSRITEQGQDYLGRWTYARLATKDFNMIYIITVYKPCKTTLQQAGPMTVFRQQWTELRARGLTNPNPRKQFDKDLLAFLQSIHQQGHRMILLGDLNETTNNSKLIQQFKKYGLYDMIKDRHDNLPNFRSCLKGGNTIDYAFCSISFLRSITASVYEPFYLHSNSDHCGIVIDLN